ncbi:MAG: hypothetical protein U0325_10760 [Polyangiales bacterium]
MFSGDTSRCTTPALWPLSTRSSCAAWRPRAASAMTRAANSRGIGSPMLHDRRATTPRDSPWRYSIAMK